ncbi:unnamed protein product [Scytosiphon promiscuus]
MCFMDGYGCHFDDSDYENCMSSMSSYLFFDDDFVEGQESHIAHEVSDEFGNCITFDLSALEADSTPASYETEATPYIWVYWTASTAPAEDDNYRAMVGIIVGDLDISELTLIPYVRTEFPRTEDVLQEVSVVMIQKTHKTHLSGDEEDVFATWSIATAESTPAAIEDFDEDEEMAIGRLALKIEQAPFSLVRISDDTPLNIGSLLGNIGGFWELLLVAWAVFFVSTRRDSEPEFKARDLADSIKKGKEAVGRRFGRPRTAASAQTTEPATELQPDWEAPYRAAFAKKGSACGNASANGIAASDSGNMHTNRVGSNLSAQVSGGVPWNTPTRPALAVVLLHPCSVLLCFKACTTVSTLYMTDPRGPPIGHHRWCSTDGQGCCSRPGVRYRSTVSFLHVGHAVLQLVALCRSRFTARHNRGRYGRAC